MIGRNATTKSGAPISGRRRAARRRAERDRLLRWPALASLFLLLLSCGGGGGKGIRNVLLITLDTTRSDYIGCYGATNAKTPTLDRLAREGTRFAMCTTAAPLTAPSHSTILTGTYPFVHKVRENGTEKLGAQSVTLAEILKGAGFQTHAVVASFVLTRQFGLGQGFDTFDEPAGGWAGKQEAPELSAKEVVDRALPVLEKAGEAPFFLWTHFYDPHAPYVCEGDSTAPPEVAYADEIRRMDAEIGRMLGALRDKKLDRNTLVVVVGDHGEGFGEHGEKEHGFFLYANSMDVPLLFWRPGTIAAGKVVPSQVRTVDLVPTILDYLGLPASATAQGVSLRPLLGGEGTGPRLAAYGESVFGSRLLGLSRLFCLQEDGWKYIHSTRPELYYLPDDPREENNCFDSEPDRAERMRETLDSLLLEGEARATEEDRSVELSQTDREKLEALGYATGIADEKDETGERALAVEGERPVEHAEAIALYLEARHLLTAKNYEEAATTLRRVVLELPDAPLPRHELSAALRRLGRGNELFAACQQALVAHPDAFGMRAWYSRQLFGAGRGNEAIPLLEEAIRRNPENGAAHGELGGLLQAMGRTADARAHFEKALALGERTPAVLRGLAVILEEKGDRAGALKLLEEALARSPKSETLQRDLARVKGP